MSHHPRQPVVLDAVGTARFKENSIVRHLLEHGSMDMNQIAAFGFSDEDREQFVQLIGYSIGGTVNMDYVSTDLWNAAQAEAEALLNKPAPAPRPLNGCHNKPRPTAESTYPAQDGWYDLRELRFGRPGRVARTVAIKHTMSTTCQYDKSATDVGCRGCQHGSAP